MASNYTEHYGLCQWEATDQVLREEFNQDNAKVDTALEALDNLVTQHGEQLSAQEAAIAKLGNCTIYYTTYTGTGTTTPKQTFPGKPLVVMVADSKKGYSFIAWRGMQVVLPHHQDYGTLNLPLIWEENSLSWSHDSSGERALNQSGAKYQMLALLDASA